LFAQTLAPLEFAEPGLLGLLGLFGPLNANTINKPNLKETA